MTTEYLEELRLRYDSRRSHRLVSLEIDCFVETESRNRGGTRGLHDRGGSVDSQRKETRTPSIRLPDIHGKGHRGNVVTMTTTEIVSCQSIIKILVKKRRILS